MNNKIAFYAGFNDFLREHGAEEAAKLTKKYGFSGVEFLFMARDGEIPTKETAQKYKRALEAEGLEVACVSCGASLVKAEAPSVTDMNTIENLCKAVDFAKAVGSNLFHHTLYLNVWQPPVFGYYDAYKAIVNGAELVANYAASRGMTVIYEPQGWFFNGCEGFLKFYREIKLRCKNVGICFDVGNTYWVDEEPSAFLEATIDDVFHVHIKDYIIDDKTSEYKTRSGRYIKEVPVGQGEIKLIDLITKLKDSGYSGYYSNEDATDTQIEKKFNLVYNLLNAKQLNKQEALH